ncbi:MAG TPA: IclR family transcriptional regulator [Trebonia sp.]|nr:IclR family transcriptional regulator [Trebonia sp.]
MEESGFSIGQQDDQRARQQSSVQRAIQLLRLFLDADNGLSVTGAANALGVGKSTVSRLLATLAAEGLVVMNRDTRRYHVGPLAFQIGNRFAGANLALAVQPLLRDLAEQAQCTAQIGTLDGVHVVYLSVSQGPGRLRVVASPGDRRYLHTSAMGKALLAVLPPEDCQALVKQMLGQGSLLPTSAPMTIGAPDELARELDLTRRRGYSATNEEAALGVDAVGMVVQGPPDFPLAISVAYPVNQHIEGGQPRLIELLSTTAVKIRQKLSTTS